MWTEVADRVFVRRYAFADQNIVAILGRGEAIVVDTRSSHVQAREIVSDLRSLGAPPVPVVVNTHGHSDHAFGNRAFRPAVIWGHERCAAMVRDTGERQRAGLVSHFPEMADELAEVELDPPDRLFTADAIVEIAGRSVSLRYLGRGHTDNDIVVCVDDARAICAGDLLENGATPFFADGYPLDWPATAETLLGLVADAGVVIPGHGDPAGRAFAEASLVAFRSIAGLARRVHAGEISLEEAMTLATYPAADAREPLERALWQLDTEAVAPG